MACEAVRMRPKTFLLIDALNYIYRAFHAVPHLSRPDGHPTNATYGFAKMIKKLLDDRAPSAVAVCFDSSLPSFRQEISNEYKANRPSRPMSLDIQIKDIRNFCKIIGMKIVESPGFEADDVIASFVKRTHPDLRIEIASGDKDFYQLVKDPRVFVWHPVRERLLDEKAVEEIFGVPPSQVRDVLSLMGDSSDNVAGIRGIGEKTAKTLIHQYGSLKALYEGLGTLRSVRQRELLIEGRDAAFRSRRLVGMSIDAEIGTWSGVESVVEAFDARKIGKNREKIDNFYAEFAFKDQLLP